MLIVCAEQALVEAELVGGLLACPSCREVLGPWGHARERVTRRGSGDWRGRPRWARCKGCAGTHVLLAELCLLRRGAKGALPSVQNARRRLAALSKSALPWAPRADKGPSPPIASRRAQRIRRTGAHGDQAKRLSVVPTRELTACPGPGPAT